jgi:hypothetical protein
MTASISPSIESSRRPSPAAAIAIAVVAGAAVLGLFIAGVTFIGLAIAFPIAVPVAAHYGVAVAPADAALAERLADFWAVFAGLGFASLVGAVVVAIKALQALSPTVDD